MKIVLKDGNNLVVALESGEDFSKELKGFLVSEKIHSAYFTSIGAASYVQLGFYSLELKNYELKEYNGQFEIMNLTGNVATLNGELVLHVHGTFGREDFSAFGGHVFGIKVKPSLEIHLTVLEGGLVRELDESTGLKLLK